MSEPNIKPSDFAEEMRALAEEAEKQIDDLSPRKTAPASAASPAPAASPVHVASPVHAASSPPPGFLQMLRPLVLGLEALSRATVENTIVLSRLENAAGNHDVVPRILSGIEEKFQNKNDINQQLFDALHQELKGYKDGFILEVLQKPMVRDLITLYDDFSEIQRQMDVFAKDAGAGKAPQNTLAKNVHVNLHHVMQFLIEIMARMEVSIIEPSMGKLNKATQRAVSVELADTEAEDGDIIRSVKPGFMWRDRIFRAEEVVIKKWKEGFLVALGSETKKDFVVQQGISDATN